MLQLTNLECLREITLGLCFFFIYINDISVALNSATRLFADETCIIIHQSNQAALTEETIREVARVVSRAGLFGRVRALS